MKSICFFNCFHNGDVFNSKAFVTEIMKNIDTKYFYAHDNNKKIIADLPIEQVFIRQIEGFNDCKPKFIVTDNIVFVNTWIGAYFEPDGECTLNFSYNMYQKIYEKLNELFGSNLKLNDNISYYFPSVDYSKFPDVENVNRFVDENSDKRLVLVSNGPGNSNQCSYNEDMQDIIIELAKKHTDTIFIITKPFEHQQENIKSSYHITLTNANDLNEISYLSKFCDIIIGQSSGPYSFSCIYNNMIDSEKTFFCFGDRITDCFQYGVETESKFIFHQFQTKEILTQEIEKCLSV